MYNLSICAIFKNESHILDEWIQHYLKRNINHFYLINYNSTDDYIPIINKLENIQSIKISRRWILFLNFR